MSNLSKKSFCSLLIALSTFAVTPMVEASWWNPFSWFRKPVVKRAETLLVTRNYIKSRILAELIQFETDQPILLLPSGNEDNSLYFLAPNKESFEVRREDYIKFVDFLQPRRVLFLGNGNYVPAEYPKEINDRVATWALSSDDWETIAFSAGEMLHLKHLGFDYLVLLNQLDDTGRLKTPAPTEEFGGYMTNRKYWTPPGSDASE